MLCKAPKIMGEGTELKTTYIKRTTGQFAQVFAYQGFKSFQWVKSKSWWPYKKTRHSLKGHYDEESRELCIACVPLAFKERTGRGNGSVDKSIFAQISLIFHCVVASYLKTFHGEIIYLIWLSTRDYLGREHVALQVVTITSLEDWCTRHNQDMTENCILLFKT